MKEIFDKLGFKDEPIPDAKTFWDRICEAVMTGIPTDLILDSYRPYEWAFITYNQYMVFTCKPLTLSMFVPVSEDGEVLEEPEDYGKHLAVIDEEIEIGWNKEQLALGIHKQCEQHQQAQERVIFEPIDYETHKMFDGSEWIMFFGSAKSFELNSGTIEETLNNGVKLKLIK